MEHRWGQRVVTSLPVWLTGRRSASGRLLNVSISGALIETPLSVRPSACITVETPERDGLPLKLRACVVRAGEGVIAVEWLELAPLAILGLLTEGRYASVACESDTDPARPPRVGCAPVTRRALQPPILHHPSGLLP